MILCCYCKRRFDKKYKTQKFCSLRCSNRYNLNGLNKVVLPRKSKELAEFIGIMLGDGNVSKYFSRISLNSVADREYIDYVVSLSKQLFGSHVVSVIPAKNMNMVSVQISSKIISDFLRKMGLIPYNKKLPDWVVKHNKFSNACIKGLIDTEGSISFKKYRGRKGISVYKQLNFRNADTKLMKFVRDALVKLGLRPTQTLKRSLYLSSHSSIECYRKIIGFGNRKLLQRSLVTDLEGLGSLER